MDKQQQKPIRPRLPVKYRVLEATLAQLGNYGVEEINADDIAWRAQVTQADYRRAFANNTELLQATCWHFYEFTMQRNSRWALDPDNKWTVRERYEAFLHTLNLGDDPSFFAKMNHIISATDTIWPEKQNPAFDQQYFQDCWINPLFELFRHIMREDQARTLALSTGNRLHEAAIHSGYKASKVIKELRYEMPSMYDRAKL